MTRTRARAIPLTTAVAVLVGAMLIGPPVADSSVALAAHRLETSPSPSAVDNVWRVAGSRLLALTGPRSLPFGSTAGGPYRRTDAFAWTAGFFPASLWLAYAHEPTAAMLENARRYTDLVLRVATWRGTHDLGLMVGIPAELGLQLDPDSARRARYEHALDTAAVTLSTRWNARVSALKSADYGGRWGVVIDSAMNAPLLISAGQRMGGTTGRRLAHRGLAHLLTLVRDFVRPDGSTFHRMAFNPHTGRLIAPLPGQGRRTTSTWSRGQAWAIAGFAQGYTLTRDPRLLDVARRTADYWTSRVSAETVPAWDLDIADPGAPRDSSAAAIAAYGLLSLAAVDPDNSRAGAYRAHALAMLATLIEPPWVTDLSGGAGILQRQAFSVPLDPREGTYAWGDTFLLKALASS